MNLNNLQPAEGSTTSQKRIGRGQGSGRGGTSTRGHKGQKSRSGYSKKIGFEGGQMPINRRLPKFGFNNRFRVDYQVVNVSSLQDLADKNKLEDNKINFEILYNLGVLSKKDKPLKILGNGKLTSALIVEAHKISVTAKKKIETAGGTVVTHE